MTILYICHECKKIIPERELTIIEQDGSCIVLWCKQCFTTTEDMMGHEERVETWKKYSKGRKVKK